MSVIDAALKEVGIKLNGDTLPKGERTVKAFRRLIAAMRSAEAVVIDDLSAAQNETNVALKLQVELQERCHHLERLVAKYELTERLGAIDALSTADRNLLLEVSPEPMTEAA